MSETNIQRPVILCGKKVTKQFGGLTALSQVNFEVEEHAIKGLIGPNGAGKTTLFNCITGSPKPTSGDIWLGDVSLVPLPAYEITRRGIARTFQNIRLFKEMSVIDNVLVGMHVHMRQNLLNVLLKTRRQARDEREKLRRAEELLEVVGLIGERDTMAKNLPYGAQRRLEIARALAAEPRLLLLDEPSAGMNPNETEGLMQFIHEIREEFDLTILLIEHDMKFVMGLCESIMVLNNGVKIAEGTPEEIQANEEVIEAYLGRRAAHAAA